MRIGGGAVSIADVTDRTSRNLGFVRPFWLNEIRAGRGFIAGGDFTAGVGDLAHLQLINPAGSGVTIIVHRAWATKASTGNLRFRTFNTAITTLLQTGVNLRAGSAAAQGQLRSQGNNTLLGTAVVEMRLIAHIPWPFIDAWGWELGEAEGVLVGDSNSNQLISAQFEWIEV